ncbi:Gfo/Idh/MocA family oxidoreductase [Nocardia terpenica]|uniref:Gfo/Idh/MocA family protein n=1 Tax=Nocardia terpenica TaxID=455432 RepID=UPI001895D61C|nr:Gfo/Idh/MocA family oxidoreductase [Nocardia terpenica]MBF6065344.1 Gfo/Idh/MocA family oxidoreductase [Nocardia terpenica]MBF6108916.1 Gfo/Idh/MocA family oxidoreductase [Nocardia terpenica]MBF6121759.1 Gfo/Idh/MocA family oxidoreductase [Nocardia terpenica]
MKIALLGTGFGQAHAAVYATRDVEVTVFGRRPEVLRPLADRYGFATTTDLDSVFADPTVELIDICLPTDMHSDTVLRALDAGKHVLTELPLATDIATAKQVAAAATASDRQVFVDMYDRFLPANQLLFDAVGSRKYGRLQHLAVEQATALLWPGVGISVAAIPLDMMHGDIDLIVQALGVPDTLDIQATAGGPDTGAVEAILGYPEALARCSGSSLMPMPYGSRGGYRATFTDGVLHATFAQGFDGKPTTTVTTYTADGEEITELPAADPYSAMIDHVLACLRGQATNRIGPDTVLDTLAVTLDIDTIVNPQ